MRWVREEEKEMAPGERPIITEPDGSFKVMVPSAYDRWRMSLKDKRFCGGRVRTLSKGSRS